MSGRAVLRAYYLSAIAGLLAAAAALALSLFPWGQAALVACSDSLRAVAEHLAPLFP